MEPVRFFLLTSVSHPCEAMVRSSRQAYVGCMIAGLFGETAGATIRMVQVPNPRSRPHGPIPGMLAGFEMIASAAEESRSPNRDVPIATVGSVSFCGVLYILMAMVITGLVPYTQVRAGCPPFCTLVVLAA